MTATTRVDVFRIPMDGPGDVSGLVRMFDQKLAAPEHVVAIFGKTEGNGGVNDYTREYASRSFALALSSYLNIPVSAVEERVALVMSGGTEGILSPHATVFCRAPVEGRDQSEKRLSIGFALTRDFLPEELGTGVQVQETAKAVRLAMDDAGIKNVDDVHFVQIKCPLLTSDRVRDARRRDKTVVTDDSYGSMAYSRGASALGVGLALGEIADPIDDQAILEDFSLFSTVASSSAGIELLHNVVVVLGNSQTSCSDYRISHSVMQDAIDMDGVRKAFLDGGVIENGSWEIDSSRIVNVFAKAEPSPNGLVRNFRHTMLNDTDISATRHARAAVGGLLGGMSGCGAIYVSGGAEHQGPSGGGPIAVIATA
jgi:cyanuric acid amidohydrolase